MRSDGCQLLLIVNYMAKLKKLKVNGYALVDETDRYTRKLYCIYFLGIICIIKSENLKSVPLSSKTSEGPLISSKLVLFIFL